MCFKNSNSAKNNKMNINKPSFSQLLPQNNHQLLLSFFYTYTAMCTYLNSSEFYFCT